MTLRERMAASVADIRSRGQRLLQLNLELLAAEMKEKGKKVAAGIGLFAAAGLLALYALGFALVTIAVALALVLPLWLALLIVTLALVALVAALALVGRAQLRQLDDPKPEAAIAQAKATVDALQSNLRETREVVCRGITPRGQGDAADASPPEPPIGTAAVASTGSSSARHVEPSPPEQNATDSGAENS